MELGKFEKEAKLKLAERELKPSAGSWEKIADSMDTSERKSAGIKWYYIAVAVVVFAIISGSFLLTNRITETKIVEETVKEIETAPKVLRQNETPVQLAGEETENEKEKTPETNALPKRQQLQSALAIQKMEPFIEKPVMPKSKVKLVPEFQTDVEQYIAEAVQANKEEGVADAEVEQLLAEAAAKLSEKYFEEFGSGELTAQSLLTEVEGELDQSFRRKLFKFLKNGFEEASYAYTNRNK